MLEKRQGIAARLNKILLIMYFSYVFLCIPVIFYLTRNQIYSQAESELTLLVDMIASVQNVVHEDTRPHFLPQGIFFPPVVSSTVMAKTLALQFEKLQPKYYINIASDNPLNLEDLPGPLETSLLERFRKTGETEAIVQVGLVQNQTYLVSASPSIAQDGCLVCHGAPENAPREITLKYGTSHGFNWTSGDVVGTSVVGVPINNINSIVIKRVAIFLLGLTILFAIPLIIINSLINRYVIRPMITITQTVQEVSNGNLEKSLPVKGNDEITDLSKALELMRRSLKLALERLQKDQ